MSEVAKVSRAGRDREAVAAEFKAAVESLLEEMGLKVQEGVCKPAEIPYLVRDDKKWAGGSWCMGILQDGRHVHVHYDETYRGGECTYRLDEIRLESYQPPLMSEEAVLHLREYVGKQVALKKEFKSVGEFLKFVDSVIRAWLARQRIPIRRGIPCEPRTEWDSFEDGFECYSFTCAAILSSGEHLHFSYVYGRKHDIYYYRVSDVYVW